MPSSVPRMLPIAGASTSSRVTSRNWLASSAAVGGYTAGGDVADTRRSGAQREGTLYRALQPDVLAGGHRRDAAGTPGTREVCDRADVPQPGWPQPRVRVPILRRVIQHR